MGNMFTCQLGNGSGVGAQLQQLNFIISFGDWLGLKFFLKKNYCSRSNVDFLADFGLSNVFDSKGKEISKNICFIKISDDFFLKKSKNISDKNELKELFLSNILSIAKNDIPCFVFCGWSKLVAIRSQLPFLFNENILRSRYFLYRYSDTMQQNDNYTVIIHARRGDVSIFEYGNQYISAWQIDNNGNYGPKIIDSEDESSYKLLMNNRIKDIVDSLNRNFSNVSIYIVSDGYERGLKIVEDNLDSLGILESDFTSIKNRYSKFFIEGVCSSNITYVVGEDSNKIFETIRLIQKAHCVFYGTGSFIPATLGYLSNPDKKIRSYSLNLSVNDAINNELKYISH